MNDVGIVWVGFDKTPINSSISKQKRTCHKCVCFCLTDITNFKGRYSF